MTCEKIIIKPIAIEILPDGRMTAQQAARYLGFTEKTLASMRTRGTGPQFIKRGRIFYYQEDLDTWLNHSGRLTKTFKEKNQMLSSSKSKENA